MRVLILILSACLLTTGCAKMKSWMPWGEKKEKVSSAKDPVPIVVPASSESGKVAKVDLTARFVVITFPIGAMPKIGQRLNVYRAALKVGELKVTGPQQENNTVADILAGAPQLNDDVRAD